jgi:hypothetical protein
MNTTSNWDLTGKVIVGNYIGKYKVVGKVTNSRVKYGTHLLSGVQHTVELNRPVTIMGTVRTHLLIDDNEVVAE